MLRWIFALLLIPFLDAVLLAVVVSQTTYIGWVGMVLLVVLTGLVGMLLVRAEGRRTLRKMQRSLVQGEPPTNQLLDGALLIAAGAFLLTPGLVTDLIGFLIAVPITRIPIRTALKRYVVIPYADKKTDGLASGAVWTFGFPDGDHPGAGGPTDTGSAGPAGGSGSRTQGPGTGIGTGTAGGTYDLGDDDYTVDTGSSSSSGTEARSSRDSATDSNTIDIGTGEETENADDSDEDSQHAR
ncbi:FxsA domain protein [Natrialba magadii ATCC 43099]|uniref:FxsA domain protein n=1 Tax=Natrialba magadii (strain ATCC 43099 / DSM 3394 / CCM 3739 / CIP 104546 / IAM 13178 / JCM 8861 / NBRC 102185 / NCIMB 2190 / MS3) TaxID=547559 RepID=D3T0D0_NATMM|nr:FxsA family protein [Natrialba magadii]ADD06409.1 FxsA domain protein [Natrialba magadii ATCC 43099]ELY31704.1 phage T7 F exclusion suppressor FxsA [Natrialba magadii ATCC 43099]